jgi:hypothetical protein
MTILKRKIEGSVEVTERRGRRHKQLLDNLNTLWTGDEDFRF